jgi:hypothetical protein
MNDSKKNCTKNSKTKTLSTVILVLGALTLLLGGAMMLMPMCDHSSSGTAKFSF